MGRVPLKGNMGRKQAVVGYRGLEREDPESQYQSREDISKPFQMLDAFDI